MDIICQSNNTVHNYFAWPSITRTKDNRIVVGASGFRRRHICPYGKAVITESVDEGKTYGLIRTIIDTCLDDRDCGLLAFGDAGLIVTSFNNSVAFQQEYAQKLKEKEHKLSHRLQKEKEKTILLRADKRGTLQKEVCAACK
jgi:hypothetical protein